jgi:hypothetical protein
LSAASGKGLSAITSRGARQKAPPAWPWGDGSIAILACRCGIDIITPSPCTKCWEIGRRRALIGRAILEP